MAPKPNKRPTSHPVIPASQERAPMQSLKVKKQKKTSRGK